jgi:C_GCAxxG_C_C family probable redox protein
MEKEKIQELAEKAYQLAYDYDLQFGCCPQCVLAAVKETIGIVTDELITASHTLSGGGGLRGIGTCGALAGGLMALGAKFGRPRDQFGKGRYLKSFQVAKELIDRFNEKYESISCNDIQEKYTGRTYDMWNQDEITEFKSSCCKEACAELTGNIAKWVVEMMAE